MLAVDGCPPFHCSTPKSLIDIFAFQQFANSKVTAPDIGKVLAVTIVTIVSKGQVVVAATDIQPYVVDEVGLISTFSCKGSLQS